MGSLLAGITNLRMVPQAAKGSAGLTLFSDTIATDGTSLLEVGGHRIDRSIPDVTSNAVYSVLHRMKVPEYSGGMFHLTLTGNLNGVGGFVHKVQATWSRAANDRGWNQRRAVLTQPRPPAKSTWGQTERRYGNEDSRPVQA